MKKTTGPHDHSTTAALCGCHVALGLLGLSWSDGDGMGSTSPQPSDNLDQVPASILEPEAPPEASKISLQAAEQRPRHHGRLLAWRLAGVQDEEQETQEAPPVRDVVGKQLAGGIGRDRRLADDRYPEA